MCRVKMTAFPFNYKAKVIVCNRYRSSLKIKLHIICQILLPLLSQGVQIKDLSISHKHQKGCTITTTSAAERGHMTCQEQMSSLVT